MPQAVVDPEELRQFAQNLKKFNGQLRDQEHKKFAEQFDQNMKVLLRFAETADAYVPYLLRKAEHIDDYLQS